MSLAMAKKERGESLAGPQAAVIISLGRRYLYR